MSDSLHDLARTLAALTDDEYNTVTTRARGGEPVTRADEFAQFINNQINQNNQDRPALLSPADPHPEERQH